MTTPCYVKVLNKNNDESYDVGPFDFSGNELASNAASAINWIYKQIGIIKTRNPESPLIKHTWSYVRDEFLGPKANIKIEIDNIIFEIFSLVAPDRHNVIDEQTTQELPHWVKNEIIDDNT